MSSRRAAALLAGILTAAVSSPARADGGYVIPGFLFGPVVTKGFAVGAELSAIAYASDRDWTGVGGFAQLERVDTEGGVVRWALGAEATVLPGCGLELGVDHRSETALHGGTFGLHVGPFLSGGLFTMALRITAPLVGEGTLPAHGVEVALAFAVKLPLPWGDPPPRISFGSGREMIIAGRGRVAELRARGDWV